MMEYIKTLRRFAIHQFMDEFNCQWCKFGRIEVDEGNYVCQACGALIERYIDTGAEWRYYGGDDNKSKDPARCGLPMNDLLPQASLSSIIGYSTRETNDIRVMRKYHLWNSTSYRERTLYNVFDTLTLHAVNHGINKCIVDEAKTLYKQVSDLKIFRGDNRRGLIATSIYMACKTNKVPRSAKEISLMFNIPTTTLTRGCKKFQELFKVNMQSSNADDFIARFCSKLGLSMAMKTMCKTIIERVEETGIALECTPPSYAAAVILFCSVEFKWGLGRPMIADVSGVSEVTILKCYKRLVANSDALDIKTLHQQ